MKKKIGRQISQNNIIYDFQNFSTSKHNTYPNIFNYPQKIKNIKHQINTKNH